MLKFLEIMSPLLFFCISQMFYNKHIFIFNAKNTLKLWEFFYKAEQILLKIYMFKTGKMWLSHF